MLSNQVSSVLRIAVFDEGSRAGAPSSERGKSLRSLTARDGAETLLAARHVDVSRANGGYQFSPADAADLLVVGSYGRGRTAALATDVAPHWVGGLVDWGTPRVSAQANGAEAIEAKWVDGETTNA